MRPILYGKKLTLRSPKPTDIKERISLGRHAEIIHMFGGNMHHAEKPLSIAETTQWLEGIKQQPYAWIIEHESHLLGEAKLHSIDESDQKARLAIGFYNPKKLGLGLGEEATRLLLHYAFEVLKLHRVDLRVLDYNTRAIRCYEKCGFKIEGRERESACINGNWHDDLIMGLLASEYLSS